jgi:hypothetical protein
MNVKKKRELTPCKSKKLIPYLTKANGEKEMVKIKSVEERLKVSEM